MNIAALTLNIQHIYGKGPHQLLWPCLRAAHGKITVCGIPNHLNYCVIFVVHTQFINVAMGYVIQTGRSHATCGLRV
jgi:hypothetical protein